MCDLNKFAENEDGNVAMMFAVATTMLLVLIGVGMDFSNATRLQNQLQAQVDAAVLAAASADVSGIDVNGVGQQRAQEEQIRTDAALSVISANGFADSNTRPEIEMTQSTVYLRAEVTYAPFFGGLLGRETMTISADSESGFGIVEGVDIAIVMDNTNSMKVEGKMDALKEGATGLVKSIEESGSNSKIALVPFSRYVRLNQSYRTASWLDVPTEYDTTREYQQATHTGGTCTIETRTREFDGVTEEYETEVCTGQTTTYEDASRVFNSRWDGCVGTRTPPYNQMDDAYVHKIPGLLGRTTKEVTGLPWDIRVHCPQEIVPLTDDYDQLKSDIDDLEVADNTYIPSGLIWGQRVLSPGEPFDNSPGVGEIENRKVMILMTDGNNTTEIRQDSDALEGVDRPPYIASLDDGVIAHNANATTVSMCENVKDAGIEIYTIAFKVARCHDENFARKLCHHTG